MQNVTELIGNEREWASFPTADNLDDPLLACLLTMARLHNLPASAEALTAGLPLPENQLTPALFVRAASRAGLTASVATRKLADIHEAALPVILLLKQSRACILLKKNADGSASILSPELGLAEHEVDLEELQKRFTGRILFAVPTYRFDQRSPLQAVPRTRHWFWGVIGQTWPVYSEVVVASLLINLFALATPLFSMQIYNRVVPNNAIETMWALTIGVLLVAGFDFLMRTLRGYFIDVAGKKVDIIISSNIMERVLGIRMASRPASVGAFSSNLQEFESCREFITSATLATLIDLPFVLVFVLMSFWIGGALGWVAVAAMPFIVGVGFLLQAPLSDAVHASSRLTSQRQALLIESLAGLEAIKVARAEGQFQRRWEQVLGNIARLALKARFLSAAAVNFSNLVQQLAYVAVIVLGVYLVVGDKLTTGGLIACTILTGRALAPLSQVAGLLTRYHQTRDALASIDRLMQMPVERPEDAYFTARPRLSGAVEFRNVSFAYPSQTANALNGVSFKIAAGERVAIIGRVGSGKSTIEKLLLGLYEPGGGTILADGVDLRQIDPSALRRDIGHVAQDTALFFGSVRDNIAIGAPQADDDAILRAATLAGVTEFTDRSPEGLGMQVGERGEWLSGGQRQAIAIARALLNSPPLLLLDEPTSAMDNRSEELFKARLANELQGRTMFLVSHRASLMQLVSRVIVIDHGKVVADGPRDMVLAALAGGKINVHAN